jgi:hypothetical protein
MDYTNNRKGPLKIEDPRRRRSRTIARFYATSANKRDIMQINAPRKVHENLSKLGQTKHAANTRRRHHNVWLIWKQIVFSYYL